MKKRLAVLFAAVLAAGLFFSCGSTPLPPSSSATGSDALLADTAPPQAGAQMVMIIGEADGNSSFVQSAWNTLNRYSGEEGLTSGLYQADVASPTAVLDTVELAERGGAELIIMSGATMAEAAEKAQMLYPEINFIFLDMPDGTTLYQNSVLVKFVPEQGGWLAGYAAVAEGRTRLAYYDFPDDTARKYALGFLLGAEAAAAEADLEEGGVAVYPLRPSPEGPGETDGSDERDGTGGPKDDPGSASPPDWDDLARLAFGAGADVLFVNNAALAAGATLAAQMENAQQTPLIGIAPSLQNTKPSVLAVITQDPKNVLGTLFSSWRAGRFPGGTEAIATVSGGGVSLDYDNSAFANFTKLKYDAAIDRFRLTGLASSIAVKLASGEDGALPAPETLALPHLRFENVFAPREPSEDTAANTDGGGKNSSEGESAEINESETA